MLKLCTLTGIDHRTPFDWVIEQADYHPCAEFGILLSITANSSDHRYPSRDFIERFADAMQSTMVNTALHVCGRAVDMFVNGNSDIRGLATHFGRIQLNFNARRSRFSTDDLDASISSFSRPVITQHNEANEGVTSEITASNHHVLFDASGGRGIHNTAWPERRGGKLYGYAGGFGPETLSEDISGAHAASRGQSFWVDMESNIRRENWLALDLCEHALQIASGWSDGGPE